MLRLGGYAHAKAIWRLEGYVNAKAFKKDEGYINAEAQGWLEDRAFSKMACMRIYDFPSVSRRLRENRWFPLFEPTVA